MTLTLPYPPSVNRMWRSIGGRAILSMDGRNYRALVEYRYREQVLTLDTLTGRLCVSVVAHAPDNRRRDIDNILKGPLDAMQHAGVYEDDSQIDKLTVERGEVDRHNPRVVVEIVEL